MAQITAAMVKQLREMTDSPMMECKKALVEADGDMDVAVDVLRKNGLAKAAKKAGRETNEGAVAAFVSEDGKTGALLELSCETDFVAKNSEFSVTADEILEIAFKADAADLEALKAVSVEAGRTVADKVTEKSGQTGEKVELVYYAKIEAPMCVTYIHTNHKLGVLVGFNKEIDKEVAKDVAMQAAAMAPIAIDRGDCDPAVVEKEREIGREQARLDGKPEAMLDKIAEGKVNKFLTENTLLNQPLVKNNKISVGAYIKQADAEATVVAYKRFSLND